MGWGTAQTPWKKRCQSSPNASVSTASARFVSVGSAASADSIVTELTVTVRDGATERATGLVQADDRLQHPSPSSSVSPKTT